MVRFAVLVLAAGALAVAGCKKRAAVPPSKADSDPPTPPAATTPPAKPQIQPFVKQPGATTSVGTGQTQFLDYTPPDGRFTASFPWGWPESARAFAACPDAPGGQILEDRHIIQAGPMSAGVRVCDFDAPTLRGLDIERVIDSGRDALVREFGGNVTRDERKAFGGNVVRTLTIEIPDRSKQGPLYFRYYIHGRRLYTLAILIDHGTVREADRDRFFNSFKILK